MARRRREEEHENHERWLVSYADFITLLFAFFVVMYAISSVNEGKYKVLSNSLVNAFKKNPSPGLIMAYAVAQGVFLGGLTYVFELNWPGIALQAELGKASEVDRELAQSSQLDAELVHDGLLTDRLAAQIKLEALAFEPVAQFADFTFAPLPAQALENADTQQAQLRAARERAAAARLRVRSVAATLAPKVDLAVSHLMNN